MFYYAKKFKRINYARERIRFLYKGIIIKHNENRASLH